MGIREGVKKKKKQNGNVKMMQGKVRKKETVGREGVKGREAGGKGDCVWCKEAS